MKKCPKCNGELKKLPEKEWSLLGYAGIYIIFEIMFWIVFVLLFSFGVSSHGSATFISFIVVSVLIVLFFKALQKYKCKNCSHLC